ncbi:MAG: hypothetical protein EP329_25895 [Deltaproteobacteria bacterium]|nr:MAG: hypothetical protein EP329_25895 [Deltaproteobacteria bacterium]
MRRIPQAPPSVRINKVRADEAPWRCTRCHALLARKRGSRLHVRFARGHEYIVGLPATTRCRFCQTLNEYPAPAAEPARRS